MSGLEERLAAELHKVRDPEDHSPNAEVCWYCRRLAASLVPFIRAEMNGEAGICGSKSPALWPRGGAELCTLRSGHAGWHHGDRGCDWTEGNR